MITSSLHFPRFSLHLPSVFMIVLVVTASLLFTASTTTTATATSVLNGAFTFDHRWISSSLMEINITAPVAAVASTYYAISIQPSGVSSGMTGSGFAIVSVTAGATTTTLIGLTTQNFGVATRSDSSLALVSVSTDDTNSIAVIRLNPANLGLTTSDTRSVVFATGTYSGALIQHTSSNRGSTSISFTNPDPNTPSPPTATAQNVGSLISMIIVVMLSIFFMMM